MILFDRHEDAPITDHCRRSNSVAPTLAIRGFLRPERELNRASSGAKDWGQFHVAAASVSKATEQ